MRIRRAIFSMCVFMGLSATVIAIIATINDELSLPPSFLICTILFFIFAAPTLILNQLKWSDK